MKRDDAEKLLHRLLSSVETEATNWTNFCVSYYDKLVFDAVVMAMTDPKFKLDPKSLEESPQITPRSYARGGERK